MGKNKRCRKEEKRNRKNKNRSVFFILIIPVVVLGLISVIGVASSYVALKSNQESSEMITERGLQTVTLTDTINKELEAIQKQVLIYCISSDKDTKQTNLKKIDQSFSNMKECSLKLGKLISDFSTGTQKTYKDIVEDINEFEGDVEGITIVASEGTSSADMISWNMGLKAESITNNINKLCTENSKRIDELKEEQQHVYNNNMRLVIILIVTIIISFIVTIYIMMLGSKHSVSTIPFL